MADHPILSWIADGRAQTARWYAAGGTPPPRRVVPADDRMCADIAYRLVCEGTAVLWQGDYHGGRQLLAALGRRIDRRATRRGRRPAAPAGGRATGPADAFHRHRQAQGHRARVLGMLLVPLEPGPRGPAVPLRRAPDVSEAATEAYGPVTEPGAVALRELLGAVGAHEWRRKGVDIPALGARVHPHYGVFSPVRGEYVDLVAEAPLPAKSLAFDVGTGTGVLAAVLARRGVERVVATDTDPRALACARDNVDRLGLADQVEVVEGNLFPPGRAPLVVCNPPWLPAKPTSALEHAVYDPGGGMLHGFLAGLAAHLEPGGEGWLVLSDLAEHLGLRGRGELLAAIEAAGLRVAARHDTRPRHRKAADPSDPLHAARAAEVTSLWRLTVAE
ncbi:class I SAM-dependent methyltransferase [Streptomyces sp. NBC_01808]|uniref:class I SAM-dependent methyltransferase n=1 Tax=Streptomyces sp. NBC_01808 TaxID=2975947 RepID=UPI002DDC3DBF|nr:class I SAM-dependent methyltransferase [Streptomyces sp. NBC_01808]WSA41365.1 class I SAM-dependent methyltransferase [Streptomyces sp. NBC_01808]